MCAECISRGIVRPRARLPPDHKADLCPCGLAAGYDDREAAEEVSFDLLRYFQPMLYTGSTAGV